MALVAPTTPYAGPLVQPPPTIPTYAPPPVEQQSPMGQLDPMTMYKLMLQGKGALGGAGGSIPMDAIAGQEVAGSAPYLDVGMGASAPTALGSSGAGAGGTGGGLAAFGPWAALAAAIVGNETYQSKHGNRSGDSGQYAKDLLSGNVFTQDLKRYTPDWFSKTAKWFTPGQFFSKIGF